MIGDKHIWISMHENTCVIALGNIGKAALTENQFYSCACLAHKCFQVLCLQYPYFLIVITVIP